MQIAPFPSVRSLCVLAKEHSGILSFVQEATVHFLLATHQRMGWDFENRHEFHRPRNFL